MQAAITTGLEYALGEQSEQFRTETIKDYLRTLEIEYPKPPIVLT